MKSAYRTQYGPTSVLDLREVDTPTPGPGQILVRMRAATVNRTDCGALFGTPYIYRMVVGWPHPRKVATGTDFAGEVAAVGEGVTRFSVGERVMGFDDNNLGSHAEYLCLGAGSAIARIPEGVPFDIAAASLEGAHYAYSFIKAVPLEAGQRVLLYGASGAIGSAAVQLLRNAGIQVTAVCEAKHHAAIRERGADELFDHTRGDWREELAGRHFPVVLDAVGKSTFGYCRPLLERRGIYLSSELGPGAQNIWYALAAPFMFGHTVRFAIPKDIPSTLDLMASLLPAGRFVPLIDRSYPLAELRDAFEYVASGQKVGNVLLTFE